MLYKLCLNCILRRSCDLYLLLRDLLRILSQRHNSLLTIGPRHLNELLRLCDCWLWEQDLLTIGSDTYHHWHLLLCQARYKCLARNPSTLHYLLLSLLLDDSGPPKQLIWIYGHQAHRCLYKCLLLLLLLWCYYLKLTELIDPDYLRLHHLKLRNLQKCGALRRHNKLLLGLLLGLDLQRDLHKAPLRQGQQLGLHLLLPWLLW